MTEIHHLKEQIRRYNDREDFVGLDLLKTQLIALMEDRIEELEFVCECYKRSAEMKPINC